MKKIWKIAFIKKSNWRKEMSKKVIRGLSEGLKK